MILKSILTTSVDTVPVPSSSAALLGFPGCTCLAPGWEQPGALPENLESKPRTCDRSINGERRPSSRAIISSIDLKERRTEVSACVLRSFWSSHLSAPAVPRNSPFFFFRLFSRGTRTHRGDSETGTGPAAPGNSISSHLTSYSREGAPGPRQEGSSSRARRQACRLLPGSNLNLGRKPPGGY